MRAFIGIALPDPVRDSLQQLQRALALSHADLKWVEPTNLHVTLKFLDEITDGQRVAVEAMLRDMASRSTPFTLSLEQLGAFPSVAAPRVLWVGLGEGTERVRVLVQEIEVLSIALSLRKKEERPFAAHLTLGRVRSPQHREALTRQMRAIQWQAPLPWPVDAITLYQSVLGAGGPRYAVLADIPLGSAREA